MEGVKRFINIDIEDFEGGYGGEKVVIKKGKSKTLPEIIASHIAGQLASKILIREGKDWNSDPSRPDLLKKILREVVPKPEKKLKVEPKVEAKKEEKEEEFEELPPEEEKEEKEEEEEA